MRNMSLRSSSGCATGIALLLVTCLTVQAVDYGASGDSACDGSRSGSGMGLGSGCQPPELLCEPPDVAPQPPENTEEEATHLASCYLECLGKVSACAVYLVVNLIPYSF